MSVVHGQARRSGPGELWGRRHCAGIRRIGARSNHTGEYFASWSGMFPDQRVLQFGFQHTFNALEGQANDYIRAAKEILYVSSRVHV